MPGMRSVSAALALLVGTAVQACGFVVYEGMYRVFLMRPEVAGFHELAPFYFTTNTLFEEGSSIDASMRVAEERNVLEWQAHVGKHIPLADIREALYGLDPVRFWEEFDDLRARNAFVKHLAEKDTLLLAYLRYARRCERIINNDDPWRSSMGNASMRVHTTISSAPAQATSWSVWPSTNSVGLRMTPVATTCGTCCLPRVIVGSGHPRASMPRIRYRRTASTTS
jgi:hypothetical protein